MSIVHSYPMRLCEILMISKILLKKLAAVTVVSSISVGYVAYQSIFSSAETEAGDKKDDYNSMVKNMSMFSTSYIGGTGMAGGYGRSKRKSHSSNDETSLLGSNGSYDYSRVGTEYR